MLRPRSFAALLALPLAASCVDYEFSEQRNTMTYDAESDIIEVAMSTSGIRGSAWGTDESDEAIVQRAADRLRRMADGERYFVFIAFPFVFDLDAEEAPVDQGELADVEPLQAAWNRAAERVSVLHAELFADANDEVGVLQHVRIEGAGDLVDLIDESIRESVRLVLDEERVRFEEGAMFSSAESRALLAARVESGARWVELDETGLRIHVPMTPRDLGRLFRESLKEAAGADLPEPDPRNAAALHAFVHDLAEIDVKDGVVTFHYPFGDDGQLEWAYRVPRHDDAAKLRAAFTDAELRGGD